MTVLDSLCDLAIPRLEIIRVLKDVYVDGPNTLVAAVDCPGGS